GDAPGDRAGRGSRGRLRALSALGPARAPARRPPPRGGAQHLAPLHREGGRAGRRHARRGRGHLGLLADQVPGRHGHPAHLHVPLEHDRRAGADAGALPLPPGKASGACAPGPLGGRRMNAPIRMTIPTTTRTSASRSYAWYVFSLCFVLMLLDYMARQVVVSMFPVFKQQWGLSDARLGAPVSIVSLAVGVLSVPIAVVADRTSRVKAIAIMAVVWSAATAAGAFARTYEQLLVARFFVGVGEA